MSVVLLSSLYKISHFTNFQVHKIQTKIWLHELHNNFIIFLNIKNIFPYFIVNVILGHIYVEDQIKVFYIVNYFRCCSLYDCIHFLSPLELSTNLWLSFTITKKASARAFSCLKVTTSAFIFKNLLRH